MSGWRMTACLTAATFTLLGQAAAEPPERDPALETDELVISAARTPEAPLKTAAAVTVVSDDEMLTGENLTDRQYIATQTGQVKTLGSPLLIMGGVRAEF